MPAGLRLHPDSQYNDRAGDNNNGFTGRVMKTLFLLGVLCICVIALVSTSTNANDSLALDLLNTVFLISCGVIGLLLLRKVNLSQILVVRQRGGRRSGLPVDLPVTDSRGVTIIQDRRQLSDRRKVKNDFDNQKVIIAKKASN